MIYPVIQKAENNAVKLPGEAVPALKSDCNSIVKRCFDMADMKLSENGNVHIYTHFTDNEDICFIDESLRETDEKYIIDTSINGGQINIDIYYSSDKSLWHAANTAAKMVKENCFYSGRIIDYPLFSRRGYIEGFYGKPWKHEQRLDMLRLMSQYHMNTYFYAPKNDPYHREKWDEPYPEKELNELKELVRFTGDIFVDLNFCIAPGLNIRYSDKSHTEKLIEKYRQLYSIGIKNFGLLLDDIPEELNYEEDKKAFCNIAQAHVYLINEIYSALKEVDRDITLTVCPLVYHGKGDEEYISVLGKGINSEVDIFWTGRNICSQEQTSEEALFFEKNTLHKPLYWDNYPVNDAEMFNEMHLGPITGRDKTLYLHSTGLVANTMEYFECSKIPLMTIADYLWNPVSYNSRKSWMNSLEVMTDGNEEKFLYFADHLTTSCLKQPCSEIMASYLSRAAFHRTLGEYDKTADVLSEYNGKIQLCAEYLKKSDSKLISELERWKEKFFLCCEIMKELESFYRGDKSSAEKIKKKMEEYNYSATVLTEFCFREFAQTACENEIQQ